MWLIWWVDSFSFFLLLALMLRFLCEVGRLWFCLVSGFHADARELKCFDAGEDEKIWGGVWTLGALGSFYVSVNSPYHREGMDILDLSNITTDTE